MTVEGGMRIGVQIDLTKEIHRVAAIDADGAIGLTASRLVR